jgi:hypothetical protein
MRAALVGSTRSAFSVLDSGPFRLIIEGSAARARQLELQLIKPVCERFKKQFFVKSPARGTRVVLFSRPRTYRTGARALSGETPDTPYGYYASDLRAVIMDLSTGGGTLVHELVHTFAEADFPEIPAWFNEGLGSLFEQSSFAGGKIRGLTNWRLPALQKKLRADPRGANGLLARVVATSTMQFYGPGSGMNYAVARYLCYDLQQRGLLERYYKAFRAAHRTDPSGRKTLEKFLGTSLDRYEPGWRVRTIALRY